MNVYTREPMPDAAEMPLQEVLQALTRTPVSQPQLRAALATTCARWQVLRGETEEAVRHLGHALDMVPDLRPAMRLLYRIYLDQGDVRSAVAYLDQEIRATRHPREAAALYRERGLLVEAHFHDLAAADQCYRAALKATPRDLAVLRAVERVSLARGEVFPLIANLESQLEVLQDETSAAGVLHDLALLEARHRGDLGLAGDMLLAAVERFGQHLVLTRDLFRIAEVGGDAELLLRALEGEAESGQVQERAFPLARASVTLRTHDEPVAAVAVLLAAARAQPNNVSCWRSLEEQAMDLHRYEIALEACVAQLKALRPSGAERAPREDDDRVAQSEIFYRIGTLALFHVSRPADGLAAMRKAFRLAPGHPLVLDDAARFLESRALWAQHLEFIQLQITHSSEAGMTREELALAHTQAGQIMEDRLSELDRARRAYEDAIAADERCRPPRDRLERILHRVGDSEGLRRYYADELRMATNESRRMFALSVLGQLHAVDSDPQSAIKYLVGLLKMQPDHLSSLQLLARLLAKADKNKELLRVTDREISLTKSPARRAKLLQRAGEIALQQAEPARARTYFEQALEAVDDYRPSLESLGRLLRRDGDPIALVELLRKESMYANDRSRQVALQLDVAKLLVRELGRDDEAVAELERLRERWPRHLPAMHEAEALSAVLERPDLQLRFLEQRIGAVTGPRSRALLFHRSARLRFATNDEAGAIRELERALELWPKLTVAREDLLDALERQGLRDEYRSIAETGLAVERGADDRRALALGLARMADLSGQPVAALQYLSAVTESNPEDESAQLRLAQAAYRAGRPSRQAGALNAALAILRRDASPQDPSLAALRYIAARAEEAAGNLDAAEQGYRAILEHCPDHRMAERGRVRVETYRHELADGRSVETFEAHAAAAKSGAVQAALLTLVAELLERGRDLRAALRKLEDALVACPDYLPAVEARIRVLQQMGQDNHLFDAIEALEGLAAALSTAPYRAVTLCRAGTIALRLVDHDEPNPRAWRLFAGALQEDPRSDHAVQGLRQTCESHGPKAAPPLLQLLRAHLLHVHAQGALTPARLRDLVALVGRVDGPAAVLELVASVPGDTMRDVGLLTDLAAAHARLDRWNDAVMTLRSALEVETSRERRGALHVYAGEACERAGDRGAAIIHYLNAGHADVHPRHAMTAACRLAAEIGSVEHQIEALHWLARTDDVQERIHCLRELAALYRGRLADPERSIELTREVLLLDPVDLDAIVTLRSLLDAMDRKDEARAVLLAGIAHHRAALRHAAPGPSAPLRRVVAGLAHLFDAAGETMGADLARRILEPLERPMAASRPRPLDSGELWPLPQPQQRRPFDGLIGDLPAASAIDLLREGIIYFGEDDLRGSPAVERPNAAPLSTQHPLVTTVRSLAEAMRVPMPTVVGADALGTEIETYVVPTPSLAVSRSQLDDPMSVVTRDAIGRALLRLSTGGEPLRRWTDPSRLLTLLVALARAAGTPLEDLGAIDASSLAAALDSLSMPESAGELAELATRFAASLDGLRNDEIMASLVMAEDRAGVVCSADPSPALARVLVEGTPEIRARTLVTYLLSDDHLALRRSLGYHAERRVPAEALRPFGTDGATA